MEWHNSRVSGSVPRARGAYISGKLTRHSLHAQPPSGIYLPRYLWTSKLGLRAHSPGREFINGATCMRVRSVRKGGRERERERTRA